MTRWPPHCAAQGVNPKVRWIPLGNRSSCCAIVTHCLQCYFMEYADLNLQRAGARFMARSYLSRRQRGWHASRREEAQGQHQWFANLWWVSVRSWHQYAIPFSRGRIARDRRQLKRWRHAQTRRDSSRIATSADDADSWSTAARLAGASAMSSCDFQQQLPADRKLSGVWYIFERRWARMLTCCVASSNVRFITPRNAELLPVTAWWQRAFFSRPLPQRGTTQKRAR